MTRRTIGVLPVVLLLLLSLFLLLFLLLGAWFLMQQGFGFGSSRFTGTFMADTRPTDLSFVSLTQTGNTVTGSLTFVSPDGQGSTTAQTVSLQGTADGDALTLNANYLFANTVLTGRRSGQQLILSNHTQSGQIATTVLLPTSQTEFNRVLGIWQADLADQAHVRQQATATQAQANQEKTQAQQNIRNLSDQLSGSISTLESAPAVISDSLSSLQSTLANEALDIQQMQDDLKHEKDEAAVRPMTCYQANDTIEYVYSSTMNYDYNDSLAYHRDSFVDDTKKLEMTLSQVSDNIHAAQNIAFALDQVIKASVYPLPRFTAKPGDELVAITAYQAVADAARTELGHLKDADGTNLQTANTIMTEGKSVLDGAKALVSCPP